MPPRPGSCGRGDTCATSSRPDERARCSAWANALDKPGDCDATRRPMVTQTIVRVKKPTDCDDRYEAPERRSMIRSRSPSGHGSACRFKPAPLEDTHGDW